MRSELLFPERCYQLSLTYRAGNFVRYFRSVAELPLLLLLAVRRHCDLMLARAVTTSQAAYRSPNLKVPLSHLANILWTDQAQWATLSHPDILRGSFSKLD